MSSAFVILRSTLPANGLGKLGIRSLSFVFVAPMESAVVQVFSLPDMILRLSWLQCNETIIIENYSQ